LHRKCPHCVRKSSRGGRLPARPTARRSGEPAAGSGQIAAHPARLRTRARTRKGRPSQGGPVAASGVATLGQVAGPPRAGRVLQPLRPGRRRDQQPGTPRHGQPRLVCRALGSRGQGQARPATRQPMRRSPRRSRQGRRARWHGPPPGQAAWWRGFVIFLADGHRVRWFCARSMTAKADRATLAEFKNGFMAPAHLHDPADSPRFN